MRAVTDIVDSVLDAYIRANGKPISNKILYRDVADRLHISSAESGIKTSVDKSSAKHNLFNRKIRWFQQTLKQAGVLENVPGERGVWRLVTKDKDSGMHKIDTEYKVLAFSTKLGIAVLGSAKKVFSDIREPTHLCLTSPPYPLQSERNYGNPDEKEFVNWICDTLAPVVENLADGGSIVLNLGDCCLKHSPARSMYIHRLVLELHDRFKLSYMDNLIWHNLTKPPGPIQYASKKRVHLNAGYENIIWMTNNPDAVYSDNRRVLQPHSEQHLKLIAKGGEQRARVNSDGAHRILVGAYGNPTEGKIPRNVIPMAHTCRSQQLYKAHARSVGIQPHGASMPLKLAKFLIEFFTRRGQLVVDPFSGSFTIALAAEQLLRRWIGVEHFLEYIAPSSYRFYDAEGYAGNIVH